MCQLVVLVKEGRKVGPDRDGGGPGVVNALTRLKFLSLQMKGGISGNEYLVSHQMKIATRRNPMIIRHKVTGDAHPSVGPSL